MRALFIPFDWIASERVYGQLPGCRLTQFKVTGPDTLHVPTVAAGLMAVLRESVNAASVAGGNIKAAKGSNATPEIQVSGASGRVGAADGDNIAAAQITQ